MTQAETSILIDTVTNIGFQLILLMLQAFIVPFLYFVIRHVLVLGTLFVTNIKHKIGEKNIYIIQREVETAIRAVEQTSLKAAVQQTGKQKLEAAIYRATNALEKKWGIQIDEDALIDEIESAIRLGMHKGRDRWESSQTAKTSYQPTSFLR